VLATERVILKLPVALDIKKTKIPPLIASTAAAAAAALAVALPTTSITREIHSCLLPSSLI
jgi:hypothetical protein